MSNALLLSVQLADPWGRLLVYKAASPDEGALVSAARQLGWEFHHRGHKFILVKRQDQECRWEARRFRPLSLSAGA